MGFFNFLCGRFRCVRCNEVVNDCIQTKLFHADASNSTIEYKEGDSVIVDGLDDYCLLNSLGELSMIKLVIGDWACSNCGLNYQWAQVALSVARDDAKTRMNAVVKGIKTFVPRTNADFLDINYVDHDLARLSAYPNSLAFDLGAFCSLSVEEKIDLIVSGYQRWYAEIAAAYDDR